MSLNTATANAYNQGRNYSADAIRIVQREVAAPVTGAFNTQTASRIHAWQGGARMRSLTPDGKMGPVSLGTMVGELTRAGRTTDAATLAAFPIVLPPGVSPPAGTEADPVVEFRAVTVTPIALRAFGSGWMMGGSFRVIARFNHPSGCGRLEYRQRIKGTATVQRGRFTGAASLATWVATHPVESAASFFEIPGGLPRDFVEDGQIVAGVVHRFGHRSAPAHIGTGIEDRYLPSQASGCEYRAQDTYGLRGNSRLTGLRIKLDIIWQGRIIDTSRGGAVIRTLHWGAKKDDIIV